MHRTGVYINGGYCAFLLYYFSNGLWGIKYPVVKFVKHVTFMPLASETLCGDTEEQK